LSEHAFRYSVVGLLVILVLIAAFTAFQLLTWLPGTSHFPGGPNELSVSIDDAVSIDDTKPIAVNPGTVTVEPGGNPLQVQIVSR